MDVQSTIDTALARIQAAGRVAGTLTLDATVSGKHYVEAGVRFLMTGVGGWITSGAAWLLKNVQKARNPNTARARFDLGSVSFSIGAVFNRAH